MAGERLEKPISGGNLELPPVPTKHSQMLRVKTGNGITILAHPNHNSIKDASLSKPSTTDVNEQK